MKGIKIIIGRSHLELGERIAKELKVKPVSVILKNFADGENYFQIQESIRGEDVFIIQPTITNNDIMELLIMIDATKRASAEKITVVIPYYSYARQDRKAFPRESITAKLLANLITVAGANRVLTVDLHTPQIQGFFDILLDDIWAFPLFTNYLRKNKLKNLVIVSPDAGGMKKVKYLGSKLGVPIAMIDKRRSVHNKVDDMKLVGEVTGMTAVLFDDMIDTGGTICRAATLLKEKGAKDIYICATHAVFSREAISKLQASDAKEVLVTNTRPVRSQGKIKVLDISKMVAIAIKNTHLNKSISTLDDQLLWRK